MVLATMSPTKPKRNRQAKKRQTIRESLWPESEDTFWNRTKNKGFTTIPRVMPLIMRLIDELGDKKRPSAVYLELWARVFDEGLVSIQNEKEFAFAAGYNGTRAERSMRERLLILVEQGFIKAKRDGLVEYGHILIVNPLQVCVDLNAANKVSEQWWSAFVRRTTEVGAALPNPTSRPRKMK
jgi:hypothetical protein